MTTVTPTDLDLELSAGTMGIFICLWPLTAWTAIQHTRRNRNPTKSVYIWMIWVSLAATLIKTTVGFLAVRNILLPSDPGTLVATCIAWAVEIHLIVQIILNRLKIIVPEGKTIYRLKIIYVGILLLINVSVFVIWVPATMGIEPYLHVNKYWDPFQGSLVIAMDMALNIYFIVAVKHTLLSFGLEKYKLLIRANLITMLGSLAVDVAMIISFITFTNLMYCEQFVGLAYLVKTRIELQMATLIIRIAEQDTHLSFGHGSLREVGDINDVFRTTSNHHSESPLNEGTFSTSERI